jgi:hypothetical protein
MGRGWGVFRTDCGGGRGDGRHFKRLAGTNCDLRQAAGPPVVMYKNEKGRPARRPSFIL